jgi:hypothetical protein
MKLYQPNSYYEASLEDKKKVCNGCGAKGGIKVPSTFIGLCIKEACDIHDWMFKEGKTKADFIFANVMFLVNLIVIIINGSNIFTRAIRLFFAVNYFLAVALKGSDAFWKDKEKNDEMIITYKGSFR